MKLLVGTSYFESHGGGIEIAAGQLARAIEADPGFDVSWMASDASPAPVDFPGETISLPCWNFTERALGFPLPIPSLRAIEGIGEAVARHDAVLLHDSLYPTNAAAAVMARRKAVPSLVVQHVGLVPYRNPLLRLAMSAGNRAVAAPTLRAADQVVFISGLPRSYFEKLTTFRHPPKTIFNGVRAEILHAGAVVDRTQARKMLDIPDDVFVLLFVGRFVEKKGLHLLRKLVPRLPGTHWLMCGWGPEDPGRWNEPGVRVIYRASPPQVATAYRAADLLVLPSFGEGLPLVVQEALSLGTPVVASTELLRADPWLKGRIEAVDVDHGDEQGTIARLSQAIARYRSQYPGMPGTSVEARERYGWPAAAAQYRELLAELADRS